MANPEHLEIVLKGSKAIAQWRKNHPREQFDLSNANLSLRDLSRANLHHANLAKSKLIGTNLYQASLYRANLYQTDLSQANLSKAILSRARGYEAALTGAKLTEARLIRATLAGANLNGADLSKANLSRAFLIFADFFGANLSEANLSEAVLSESRFIETNLSAANLSSAYLYRTYFYDPNLTAANFFRVICNSTTFANCNIYNCKGLESVIHNGPSTVGIDTLMRSIATIPKAFLRGAGVPDTTIDFFSFQAEGPRYYTCFISYGSSDVEFADRLYKDLTDKGIRCWKYDESAVIGRGIWANIDRGISSYDKVIVICSKDSLNRTGVLNEIERALQKEDSLHQENARRAKEARDKGEKPNLLDEDVLCPVRLDDYVIDEWEHPRKADVTKRHIGDFREWKTNKKKYDLEFGKLLRALDPNSW